MIRVVIGVLMLSLVTASAACDESNGGDVTPEETRSTSSIDVGPVPQETAFATPGQRSLVLDVATGEIFVLRGISATGWLDDDVLITGTDVRYDLADGARIVSNFKDAPHVVEGRGATSPDGQRRLEFGEGGGADRVVNTSTGEAIELKPSERQGSSIDGVLAPPEFAWSPGGHMLAIGGGLCGDSTLQLVDPDAGTVVILNDEGSQVRAYAWTVDGTALAVSISGPEDARLELIKVADAGNPEVLAPLPPARMGSYATGLGWNPSGRRLLFHQLMSRPCPY